MLTSFRDARKTWIVSDGEHAMPLGRLTDTVVNPDTGAIEAFWVRTPEGLRLLLPDDITRWRGEIILEHPEDLVTAEEFPRLEQLLDREVSIIGAPVFQEDPRGQIKIGRVQNFTFDTLSPKLLALEVARGFWMFRQYALIPRSRLLRITEEGIFVAPNILKLSDEEKPALARPSKILPEPEQTQVFHEPKA